MDSQLLARYLSEFDLPKNVGATTDAAAPGPNLDFLRPCNCSVRLCVAEVASEMR